MLNVILTGGIGSGKSTVAKCFAELGAPIIDADTIVHELSNPGQAGYQAILSIFGNDILQPNKTLNRAKLRNIIFGDSTKKKLLEAELHPLVRKEIKRQLSTLDTPYCIISIPLLNRKDQFDFMDRILVVDAPESLQIKRSMQRDNQRADDIKKIIQSQCSQADRLALADDVITNDGNISKLELQVKTLDLQYKSQ